MKMNTLFRVAKSAPYHLPERTECFDKNVKRFVELNRPDLLNYLTNYSRSLFREDLLLDNLQRYNRKFADERTFQHRLESNSLMQRARQLAEDQLRESFTVTAISAHNFDKVPFIKSSSAGYGYQGLKRDNYELARRYVCINLFANPFS